MLIVYGSAFAFTLLILARLLWSAHTLGTSLRSRRRRHRELVDLLGHVDDRAPGARVLDADSVFAYCVPGVASRLVVSSSVLDSLSDEEIRAVLEHERAHARARHDLVLEGFTALYNPFQRIVRSRATTALGSAGSHAGGLFEFLGDSAEVKRFHPGKAARDGIAAADLAASGLTGPTTVLEGADGYFAAFAGAAGEAWFPERVRDGLGEEWVLLQTYVKPYPCCRHLHGAIDGALELRRTPAIGTFLSRRVLAPVSAFPDGMYAVPTEPVTTGGLLVVAAAEVFE
jgi:hypothetical protein